MQPAGHASDMNPNNGRRCCAAVHQPCVSLASLTLSPSLSLLQLILRGRPSRVESSLAESAWQQQPAALAEHVRRLVVAAGTAAVVYLRLDHDLFPTCSSRMQELFNSREIATDCA